VKRRSAPAAKGRLDPERLFAGLKSARGLILAVSGGPDSTALMTLAAAWAERPPCLVVTIDHGLRPEAAGEAAQVLANAAALGLAAEAARAPRWDSEGNLQDWARRARYRCLVAAARTFGADAIVTAHHRDDQAETFLIRLKRGSGVYGLAAMAADTFVDGVRLVRPLLDLPREELASVAAASGLPLVDDPSNRDVRFDRTRMRRLLPVLSENGLGAERLAATASALRRAAEALDHYVDALLRDSFVVSRFGSIEGETKALTDAPREIGLRALARLARAAGGGEYTPPLDQLEPLIADLAPPGEARLKRTLAGALVEAADGRLMFRREWGRSGPPSLAVGEDTAIIWDNRFRMMAPRRQKGMAIGPLGKSAERFSASGVRRADLAKAPALFIDGALIAAPPGVVQSGGAPLGVLDATCIVAERLAASGGAIGG
jgi:tRNA(Ile)-lysidine synthase